MTPRPVPNRPHPAAPRTPAEQTVPTARARAQLERLTLIVPDYPSRGVLFRDLTPVFADPEALTDVVDALLAPFAGQFDLVAGIEARGFLLAAAAAYATGTGLVTIRKAGKLPGNVISQDYALEYGTATIQLHPDTIRTGQRVLLMDDLVATGGTLAAAARLVEGAGGRVAGMTVAVELADILDPALLDAYRLEAIQVLRR